MKHRTAFHDGDNGADVVEDWRTLSTASNIDMRLHGSVVCRKADGVGDGKGAGRMDGGERKSIACKKRDKSSKRSCLA